MGDRRNVEESEVVIGGLGEGAYTQDSHSESTKTP